ncbi:LysR family transcriptional regulator [Tatumella citrea]|uniref:LysR family transcriptional regulator n=1 Tax=Tatumella citrea TaxID=53336 RepID=A0A1Y0L5K8_TATCI|nr:LysR family transcriptional regulator [Tatumella citrea]ARU93311.1 LysR family transcriptional regulator [Tatumella citrea]ARU97349.1 LysR family transcriptional regulator [Tatumella citrea]
MLRDELGDLAAFLVVAEERSFTRAAARLSTSQPSLSQTVRRLEERLGVRLLIRNTRNVAVTEAGEQLVNTLHPALNDINNRLQALSQFREKPAGLVRITTGQHAADTLIWPAVAERLHAFPDIKIELSLDSALTDIVSDRFDAGIRLGEQIAQDMVALRIGPDIRMAVVGAPGYLAKNPQPLTPQDLTSHSCINMRMPSAGGIYPWEFSQGERELHVRVDGQFVVNNIVAAAKAAEEGLGLAIVMEDQVITQIAEGRLVRVLDDWCRPFSGYHIYYPSRRLLSPAFQTFLQTLRRRYRELATQDQ